MMQKISNPFHLEAVVTFGVRLQVTCDQFGYMTRALTELQTYLTSYPDLSQRYGGTIGLRGGHGTGKTHILNWLAQSGQQLRQIKPACLYGKIDSPNLFDLYRQIIRQLERERLQELLFLASKNIAIELAQNAKITESLIERIVAADDLDPFYVEANLDRQQIANILETRLFAIDAPKEIAQALLELDSPLLGQQAYHWLAGEDVSDPAAIGLSVSLKQLGEESAGSATPDLFALGALETIAALHRMAGVPLVILIDQLEVLLRAEKDKQQRLFSLIKKLIECIGRQQTLAFIAGSNEGWNKLPSDVSPRMRIRDPLQVGNLTLDETRLLIDAYLGEQPGLSEEGLAAIHTLSGGNPREIIRTAFHAFDETDGDLRFATYDILLRSAKTAGSVSDRYKLALGIADEVLPRYGEVIPNFVVSDRLQIERLVKKNGNPFLAVVMLKATDKLSEVNIAKDMHEVQEYLGLEWPGTALIIVAIGYSSSEIRELLGLTSTIILFNDANFAAYLETEISKIASRQDSPKEPAMLGNDNLITVLETISSKLADLETGRTQEVAAVQKRFATSTDKYYAPVNQTKELATRWEILEALDRLSDELERGNYQNEREIIRSILVANEVYVRDTLVDHLGGLYLDAISLQNHAEYVHRFRRQAELMRGDMIAQIRRRLRPSTTLQRYLSKPGILVLLGTLTVAFGFTYLRGIAFGVQPLSETTAYVLLNDFIPGLLIGLALSGACYVSWSLVANPSRLWDNRMHGLRQQIEENQTTRSESISGS